MKTAIERKTYNVREVAAMLGISVPAAYTLVKTEGFPCLKVGKRRFVIPCQAFDRWMEEAANA